METVNLDLVKILLDLGGTAFIAVLLIYFGYKIISRFGEPFIASQNKIATAMGQQAQSLTNMQGSVTDFIGRDHNEHKEIILGLQVVGKELETLVKEISRIKYGSESNKAQPHPEADIRSIVS